MLVQDNIPSAGFITWSDCNIAYKGVTYAIADGNTNLMYIYWKYSDPTSFYGSNVYPILTPDDVLVFLNKNGVHLTVPNTTVMDGSLIVPESILTNALSAKVITAEKIAIGAVTADTIAANAIGADKIAANAISAEKIVAGAISTDKIAANAIGADKIAANAITAEKIAANTITSNLISTVGLDAGVISTGALTGITVEVTNAGMTAVGALAESVRIWAGASYSSRDSAPFRVQQDGKVIASNIDIVGGSIKIDTELYVGDNIHLGSTATDMVRKSIYFNSMANITGGGGYVGGTLEFNASDGVWDFQNHMLNYGMNLQNSSPTGALVKFTTESNVESEFSGVVRMYGGVGMAQPSYSMYINESTKGEWVTNAQETGFCGVGGVTAGINGSIAGVGVNFRIRKNYTPSSITLAATSHNLTVATNVFAIDIAGNGFWLYINSGSTTAAYRYWRGTYTA